MFATPCTLKQLADIVELYREGGHWDDALVACETKPGILYDQLMIEVVYVDADGKIVGDEANDYKPKPGERTAFKFS